MVDSTTDPFGAAGERASETRRAAYGSYSEAADIVRDRLAEVEGAIRSGAPPGVLERLRASLSVALHMKEMPERELENADQNWREWVEEARARQEDERLRRQEKTTTSATWAAWAAAAFFSGVAAAWQAFGPCRG